MAFSWLMGVLTLMKENPSVTIYIVSSIFVVLFFLCSNWNVVWSFFGMLMNFHRLHDRFTCTLQEAGGTITFKDPWFSGLDMLATCDPANMNHILKLRSSNYGKGEAFREVFDILGDGIFASDGDLWRRERKIARHLTADQKFRTFTATCTRDKVEGGLIPFLNQMAEQGKAFDLQHVFLKLTYDTTCILVLGVDPGSLGLDSHTIPFAKVLDDAVEVMFFRLTTPKVYWKLLRWLRVGPEKKLAIAWKEIDHFLAQIISKRRDKTGFRLAETRADLLTSYMNNYSHEDEDEVIRDALASFLAAGKDTLAAALSWFIWLLSKNPNVEEKILQEIKDTKSSAEETGKLVYLQAALCETMRLYPSLPFNRKAALQPDVLPSGHKVREGTTVVLPYYSMGRMEAIWGQDCLEFKPERWISEEGNLSKNHKLHAFGIGPRSCLGKDMAFTQMKIAAAAMVYNFHFHVVESHVIEPKLSIVLQMKNGLLVKVKKRKQVPCDPSEKRCSTTDQLPSNLYTPTSI